jgi:hypothetical protein
MSFYLINTTIFLNKEQKYNYKQLTKEEYNELKISILKQGLNKKINKLSLEYFRNNQNYNEDYYNVIKELDIDMKKLVIEHGALNIKIANNINNANFQRVKRLKKRIDTIIKNGSAYFITITFNDLVLTNTSELTRRRYVARYLQTISDNYAANIDYGDQTGREHYHAVVKSEKRPINTWEYGFIKIQKVNDGDKDITRLAKYTSKLTNHAIKNGNINNRIIYSRTKKQ